MIEIKCTFPYKSWRVDEEGITFGKKEYKFDEIVMVGYHEDERLSDTDNLLMVSLNSGKSISLNYSPEQKDFAFDALIILSKNGIAVKEFVGKKLIDKDCKSLELRKIENANSNKTWNTDSEEIVYNLTGVCGRKMKVLHDRCIIKTEATFSSFFTGNAIDGEKLFFM